MRSLWVSLLALSLLLCPAGFTIAGDGSWDADKGGLDRDLDNDRSWDYPWGLDRDTDNDRSWDYNKGGLDRDLDNDGSWDYGAGGLDRDLDNDGSWDYNRGEMTLEITAPDGVTTLVGTAPFVGGNATNPNYSRYGASGATVTNDTLQWGVGAGQALKTGGRWDASWGANRQKSSDLFQLTNPVTGSTLSGTFTQPFMRNFRIDSARQQLMISKKNREMSDIQLRQTVLATMRNVKNAYWNLAYQRANLEVQQESLNLAVESLKNNQARVRIGTMAPIDIIQAEAEVASREESVIRAQAGVDQAEDRFRTVIMDPATPGFWSTKFELTDKASFQAVPVDLDAAVRRALESRTDLAQQRKGLEESDINLRYMKNQTRPDLNVVAKYSMTATGGTTLLDDGSSSSIDWGSVMSSLFRRDLPTWSVTLNFAYPIGNSTAEANLARANRP